MNSLLFVITFLPISLMPGINMTLALSFGMALGYRRTLPMLAGQVFSLLFIAVLCIFGIGALLIKYTLAFSVFKICSGIYLIYLGVKGFLRRGGVSVKSVKGDKSGVRLFVKGALISLSNPNAWIFLAAILPAFLNKADPFGSDMYLLLFLLFIVEIFALNVYALGGMAFKKLLANHLRILEIVSAFLMCFIGVWMIVN